MTYELTKQAGFIVLKEYQESNIFLIANINCVSFSREDEAINIIHGGITFTIKQPNTIVINNQSLGISENELKSNYSSEDGYTDEDRAEVKFNVNKQLMYAINSFLNS